MGTFYTSCKIQHHLYKDSIVEIPKVLVDTGAECTWISEAVLKSIGITPEKKKKDLSFVMANGKVITRSVAYAIVQVGDYETIDEIILGQEGDLQILGARSLEGLNLRVDPRRKQLVSAGPILAAVAA